MTPLDRYRELLAQYHAALDLPDRWERVRPLVEEMDRVWHRLTAEEQLACLKRASDLWEARIKR